MFKLDIEYCTETFWLGKLPTTKLTTMNGYVINLAHIYLITEISLCYRVLLTLVYYRKLYMITLKIIIDMAS